VRLSLIYQAIFLSFLLSLLPLGAFAQNFLLQIASPSNSKEIATLNYKKKHPSAAAAAKEVDEIIYTLQLKGFLLAGIDTLYQRGNTMHAVISENKSYKMAHLRLGNLDPNLASKLGISEKLYFNKPFKYRELAKSINRIITYYENSGYPFAAVSLDSVQTDSATIHAVFNVQKNKQFRIDSIIVIGSLKINGQFLLKYLSLKEGMFYNEEIIRGVPQKIKQLPFIVEKRPQEVLLTEKTNRMRLFLDKKNASQFDGIIGLLPDAVTKKTVVTGDVKIKVINGIFRNGETFDLEWRRLQSQTQDFKGRIIYPYLLGTPIGIDYSIKIYRRDSTFVDINNNIGLQYYFSGLNNFKIFYKQRNSNLISTSGLQFVTVLPDYADISTEAYGFGFFYEKLNYRFNPHQGISINMNAQSGTRQIRKNPKVNENAYRNLTLRSSQYQLEGEINTYLRLYGNSVLKFGIQGASVFGNSTVFKNELFRIGGLRTLRGFNEESIFASTYFIPTIEYRFLFAQNSNLLVFAEGAWYENTSNGNYLSDTPLSVGAGINFETKAGILSLNYGLGNQFGQGFDIRNGKIHFGLTALF
jgi:outer membrane protein assembly factor BamA